MKQTIRFIKDNPEILLLAFFATALLWSWWELHQAWSAWEATGLR